MKNMTFRRVVMCIKKYGIHLTGFHFLLANCQAFFFPPPPPFKRLNKFQDALFQW